MYSGQMTVDQRRQCFGYTTRYVWNNNKHFLTLKHLPVYVHKYACKLQRFEFKFAVWIVNTSELTVVEMISCDWSTLQMTCVQCEKFALEQ